MPLRDHHPEVLIVGGLLFGRMSYDIRPSVGGDVDWFPPGATSRAETIAI